MIMAVVQGPFLPLLSLLFDVIRANLSAWMPS